jgi:hypothetical protein
VPALVDITPTLVHVAPTVVRAAPALITPALDRAVPAHIWHVSAFVRAALGCARPPSFVLSSVYEPVVKE